MWIGPRSSRPSGSAGRGRSCRWTRRRTWITSVVSWCESLRVTTVGRRRRRQSERRGYARRNAIHFLIVLGLAGDVLPSPRIDRWYWSDDLLVHRATREE